MDLLTELKADHGLKVIVNNERDGTLISNLEIKVHYLVFIVVIPQDLNNHTN